MRIAAEIFGIEKIKTKIKQIDKLMNEAASETLQLGVLKIHENAVKLIVTQSPGRKVVRYKPKRERTAASPGNPPNSDTGNLVKNILFGFNPKMTIGWVGTNLKYGKYLELGTEDMAARPWLQPAAKMSEDFIGKTFKRLVEEKLRGLKK